MPTPPLCHDENLEMIRSLKKPWSRGSFRNRSAENLGAEESSLGLLNHLLVHTLRRVIHDDRAGLVVDLGIDAGIADEVNDPLFTLVFGQTKSRGQIPAMKHGLAIFLVKRKCSG